MSMKNLEDYLQKAKEQDPVMTIGQVEDLLSKPHARSEYKPETFFDRFRKQKKLYPTLIACTMITLFIISLFLFQEPQQKPGQDIFIPESQQRITRLVHNLSEHPTRSTMRIQSIGSNPRQADNRIPIHLRSALELSDEQLKLIGIAVTDQQIIFEGNVKGQGYVRVGAWMDKKMGLAEGVSIKEEQKPGVKAYGFYPWFLSDSVGHQTVKYRFDNEPALKMTNEFFSSAMDELIPVQVKRPGFKKVIFWFSSTPELLSLLETAAHMDVYTTVDKKSADQKPENIDITLYPTVTTGDVRVKAVVSKPQNLEVSVLNSSGEVVSKVAYQALREGEHSFSMDLSRFTRGLYFVKIKSEPGLITMHRLFKE
jgi:hypothetical protein